MRLYIIRHGDPDYENDALTELGRRQAEALAERMRQVQVDRLYTSPLGRARETASHTAEAKGMTAQVLDWTAELGGWRIEQPHEKGDRVMAWDVHGHRVRRSDRLPGPDDWHEHELFDDPTFKREYDDICRQSDAFFAEHGYVHEGGAYRIERSHREAVAVFCHGGLGLTWLAHLLALPLPLVWTGFFLSPTSVTTILMDERDERWATPRCIGLGDVSHLYARGLEYRDDMPGIKANFR